MPQFGFRGPSPLCPSRWWARCLLAAGLAGLPPSLPAQVPFSPFPEAVVVNSQGERYLRALQLLGKVPAYPWTLRYFVGAELQRLAPSPQGDHPWRDRLAPIPAAASGPQIGPANWEAQILFNSAFPAGENDGALWAGRGFTVAASGGGWGRWGPLWARLGPEMFLTQNAPFPLAPNGQGGERVWQDPLGSGIDHPQRFGSGPYGRLDLGATALSLEVTGLVLGLSNEAQWWGPAQHYPLMLGNNAGGFPHAFLQTARPFDLRLARLHGRLISGRLDQSKYSPVQQGETRRFAAAAAVVVLPKGLPGLEVGVHRFSERIWPRGGIALSHILRPFATGVSVDYRTNVWEENQLAGAFFRWALPPAGFEFYGEVIREDFARDLRHYIVEPDDLMGRVFGFQRVWERTDGSVLSLRGEVVSSEVHHSERGDRFRDGRLPPRPLPRYQHGTVRQGHTQRGQILASPTAYGGSGWTLGLDVYSQKGRWSLDVSRTLRMDWLPVPLEPDQRNLADVIYTLKGEWLRFRGRSFWSVVLAPMWNLNRNLQKGDDEFNLFTGVRIGGLLWP